MAKSKYIKYEKEILEMQNDGKTSTEIAKLLNENYKGFGATQSAVRGALKRYYDKKNQENIPSVPDNEKPQENLRVEKIEKLIVNEVQIRMTAKEFDLIKEKYQETLDIFSIISNEFGEVTEKLRNSAGQQKIHFLIAGGWILTMLSALFAGYYIGRCFSRTAFLYILTLTGIPGGILIGLSAGIAITHRKNKKKITE